MKDILLKIVQENSVEQIKLGLPALYTIVSNIIQNPNDANHRKIKMQNKNVQECIIKTEHATKLLKMIGFDQKASEYELPRGSIIDWQLKTVINEIIAIMNDLKSGKLKIERKENIQQPPSKTELSVLQKQEIARFLESKANVYGFMGKLKNNQLLITIKNSPVEFLITYKGSGVAEVRFKMKNCINNSFRLM